MLSSCSTSGKLVSLSLPGRIDRGVEALSVRVALLEVRIADRSTSEAKRKDAKVEIAAIVKLGAALAANAPVAIGVSGGKDSCAAALATIEHLDAIGHTGPRLSLIHI